MSFKLKLIIIASVLITIYILVNMMRKDKLIFKHTVPWFFILSVITILTIFPEWIDRLAETIGIHTPTNAIFFVAILILAMLILPLSTSNTKYSLKQVRLVQELAIMRKELEDLKKTKGE